MPLPANRWPVRSRRRAERIATQNSPSSVASIQPTGPAYQPRSRPSSSAIAAQGSIARLPADRGRRMQQARKLDRGARLRTAGRGSGSQGAGCSPPGPVRAPAPPPTQTEWPAQGRARSCERRSHARGGPSPSAGAARPGGGRRRDPRCAAWTPPGPRSPPPAPRRRTRSRGWLRGRPPGRAAAKAEAGREQLPKRTEDGRPGRAPAAPRPPPPARAPPSPAPRRGCAAPPGPPSARTAPAGRALAIFTEPVGWGSASGRAASRSAPSRALIRAAVCPASVPGPASAHRVR